MTPVQRDLEPYAFTPQNSLNIGASTCLAERVMSQINYKRTKHTISVRKRSIKKYSTELGEAALLMI